MSVPARALALAPVLVLALAGCVDPAQPKQVGQAKADPKPKVTVDGDPSKVAPTGVADPAPPPAGDLLTLGPAKIMRAGHEDRAFELTADGTVTIAGKPYAKLFADGRMLGPLGEELMRVQADGSVASTQGPTGMTLTVDGGALSTATLQVKIRFTPEGVIEVDASGASAGLLSTGGELRASGCTGELVRACTLVTLTYLAALGNPDSIRQEDAPTQ
jgi:hypothetical protein